MIFIALAVILVIGFFGVEVVLRRGRSARSLEKTDADQGSTVLLGVTLAIVVTLPEVLRFLGIGVFASDLWAWVGIAVMATGLTIRVWSVRELGAFYSRILKVEEAHFIVTTGPYRLIRHPGYLGTILFWLGWALALQCRLAALVSLIVLLSAYGYRIHSEEAMLLQAYGAAYEAYTQRTWRLLPLV